MSNLSDIGFPTPDEQAVNEMILHVLEHTQPVKTARGFYLKFADPSGAEIYLQGNFQQELIGFNPHFAGKSRFKAILNKRIERDSSELDGGFYARANFSGESSDAQGFLFVFDAPDFRLTDNIELPHACEIQLTAFASNDLKIFRGSDEYENAAGESKREVQSFAPSGDFSFAETDDAADLNQLRPIAALSGVVREYELKTNEISGAQFYRFLIETSGGEVDVVADSKFIAEEPRVGGVLAGQFWLSGKLIDSLENSKNELFKSLIDD